MTTNAEIKTMFDGLKTGLNNLLDMLTTAVQTPVAEPPPFPRRIRTLDTNRNMVEFAVSDIWLMCALKKTVPDDPTRYTDVTRLIFRYTNAGNLVTIDLDGTPDVVRQTIGGLVPDTVEMPPVIKKMLRVPATPIPEPGGIIAISQRGPTVTDANGDVWTLRPDGGTLKNGVYNGGTGTEYALLQGKAYVLGVDDTWWYLNDANQWISVGTELTA